MRAELETDVMSEHRRELRQRTFLKGRIIFNNGASSMDCLVRDMSASGARLALSQSAILPESFDLLIPAKERTYRSSLCWRRSDGVGIVFAEEAGGPAPRVFNAAPPAAAAAPEAPAAQDDSVTITRLQRRVSELEAENAALRHTLSGLLKVQGASAA